MTAAKQHRTAKPGTLLSQWWTLGTIVRDKRASGRHVKVAWVIIDRYVKKKGNGQASLRYIEKFTGLNRHAVVKACRELTEWGYVTQRLGGGTRPSEYVPSWVTVRGSGAETLTTKPEIPSGAEMLTTVVSELTPLEAASGAEMPPESYLREPADKPASLVSSNSPAPATPPRAAGLAPAAGEAPEGGFEELWNTYLLKQDRAKAKAAYAKLNPSPELHATMVGEAGRWHAHYEEHGVEPHWRVRLHNWLAGECWLQDPPLLHTDAKGAAISKVRGSAKASKPAKVAKSNLGKPDPPPIRNFTIIAHTTDGLPFGDFFESFTFRAEDGEEFTQRLHVLKNGAKSADEAPDHQRKLEICRAAFGKGNPEGEYVGRVIGLDDTGWWHLPDENLPPDDEDEPEPSLITNMSEPDPEPVPDPKPTPPQESAKAFAERMSRRFDDEPPRRRMTIEEAEREAYESFCAEQDI